MKTLDEQAREVLRAAPEIAVAPTSLRSEALQAMAQTLHKYADEILAANAADIAEASDLTDAARDRLRLDKSRLDSMIVALQSLAEAPDPLGETVGERVLANGLEVHQVRVPLGVVGIIYENRPNVTSDAAGICIRSGNVAFLRGSASAQRSNQAIVKALREGLQQVGLPPEGITLVADSRRSAVIAFMQLRGTIDCLIPRGGPSLLQAIRDHATVPHVEDGSGNCHIYVDSEADLDQALAVLDNAKRQRPGVCNAMESLLVHRDVAESFLPVAVERLVGVEWCGDEQARRIVPSMAEASEEDFATEYLGLQLSVAIVDNVDAAIAHIRRYSTGHSEAILTESPATAERFVQEVDAAAVLVNASTRFIDGGELGLGAEIGISTQKLHCRGPMGAAQLTTLKWVVKGTGQVRT